MANIEMMASQLYETLMVLRSKRK